MLNQFAMEIPTLPVNQVCSLNILPFVGLLGPSCVSLRRTNGPPNIWDTSGTSGNVFANPQASSSAPHPQELNSTWRKTIEEPIHLSTAEKSERPERDQNLRCHSGPSAKSAIDFGQFRLRPAFFFEFGQFRLRPISTSANFGGAPKGWRPRRVAQNLEKSGPRRLGPEGWSPEGWGARKFRAFFPSSRHNFLSSFCLLGSLRGILVVFEAPGP